MAHPLGATEDDEWEDVDSYYREQLTSHGGSRPQDKTALEQAFATTNRHPSTADFDIAANPAGITSRQGAFSVERRAEKIGDDAEPHHLSEHSAYSDLNTTASIDPVAVENDIQYTSSWPENNTCESVADSGFYSAPSIVSSIHQAVDPPSLTYSASSLSYRATDSCLGDFPGQLQAEQDFDVSLFGDPWHPGARLDQKKAFEPENYFLDASLYNAPEGAVPSHVDDYHQPSTAESQPAPTVSSEPQSSVRSHTKRASKASQGGVTTCDYCPARFTGRYQTGNCSRHVRQQHSHKSAQQASDCVCRVCKKPFARQDARRKHEWKKHGLQDTRPCPRRLNEDEASHAGGTYETHSQQGTLIYNTLLEEAAMIHYRLPDRPQRARDHFFAIKQEFGDYTYNNYCEVFLEDSRAVVDALHEKQSPIHHIFDQALRGLYAQLHPEEHKYEGVNERYVDADTDINDKAARARQKHGKSPVSRRTSNASTRHNPYGGRPNKRTNVDPLIALLDSLFDQPASLDLDCPVHKWYLVHPGQGMCPCNGCAKPHMNGVRQHLLPTYSQQHGLHVSFIKRCPNCKEDVVSEDAWQSGGHEARTCLTTTQPRDIGVLVWARLYLKIFPQETVIPSPYVNDPRYLPDELVAQIQQDAQVIAPMSSSIPPTLPLRQRTLPDQTTLRQELRDHDNAAPLLSPDQESDAAAGLNNVAALDTLIAQTEYLLESLRAERQLRASHGRVAVETVEANFHARLQAQQQQAFTMASQEPGDPMPMPPPQIQVQAPINGGADFYLPNIQPDLMAGVVQVPRSYMSTQPTTYGNFQDEASYRRHSLLDSSLTDYDFGPPSTYVDQPQSAATQSYAPVEQSACPPASYFLNDQYMYDARLDVPGSSRLPPRIVEEYYGNEQMAADVDQTCMMEISPSQSFDDQRMPASYTPIGYEAETFGQQYEWYNQS